MVLDDVAGQFDGRRGVAGAEREAARFHDEAHAGVEEREAGRVHREPDLALLAGLEGVSKGAHTRQVLILVSDGDDNASAARLDDVLKQVRESDATIYAVTLIDSLLGEGNPGLMRRLARETGGEAFAPRSIDEFPDVFERIARDIRSAYTLAYAPTHRGEGQERRRSPPG